MLRLSVITAVVLLLAQAAGSNEPPTSASLVPAARFEAGTGIVRSLAWSPDNRHLAAGCSDATIRIWKPPARRPAVAVRVVPLRRGCVL